MTEQWQRFEPHGKGHEHLSLWASWNRGGRPSEGGGSWAVKERLDPVHGDVPPDAVGVIDRILCRIAVEYPDYYAIVKRFYLDPDTSDWEIAAKLTLTVGFVRSSIQSVCDLVERRYDYALQNRAKCG